MTHIPRRATIGAPQPVRRGKKRKRRPGGGGGAIAVVGIVGALLLAGLLTRKGTR